MRTAFIQQLVLEARNNPSIFLIVGDLGFSVVEPFAEEFPDRFINAGVAEQNMTGIAAGLAKEGYTVITYSIGNFPTLRCLEQIRYDVCYHKLNVKIVAVGGGYAYGPLGASHHLTEDYGMLRTIPNLTICSPGDPIEAKAITTYIINKNGPCYLRLGKAGEPKVHKNAITDQRQSIYHVIFGNRTAILTTGTILKYSFDFINRNNLRWGLHSFPVIKPLDLEGLKSIANNYDNLITIEDHQRSCGFGSAILEGLNDLIQAGELKVAPLIKRVAIPDVFLTEAGSIEFLREMAGIKL